MPRYKYTQESSTDFKVNTSDKADAMETENEKRQILDDLGELLDHSKFDDSYPADASAGGTLGYLKKSNFASTSSPAVTDDGTTGYAVGSKWINTATDEAYICVDASTGAAVWTEITAGSTAGEANTASNQGTTGIGIYYQKTGVDLEFKAIHSTGYVTVADTTGTISINLNVNTTGIPLDDFGDTADNTDLDASTGKHGLLPKLSSVATDYLSATGGWTTPVATGGATTFVALTDTPADFLLDANKLLRVNSSSGAVEFISTTGIATDTFGLMTDITTNNADAAKHGFLPKLTDVATDYLSATGGWTAPAGVGNVISSGDFNATRLAEISSSAGAAIIASPFTVSTGDIMNFGLHSAGFTEQAIATTTGDAAIDWNLGNKALFTRSTGAAGVVTFTFTAPEKSMNLQLLIQDSAIGSDGTIAWPVIYWTDGALPTITSGASALDVVSFYYSTGVAKYLGMGSANFSTV